MTEKVTVHRFRMYDVSADEWRTSRRWGTREGIEAIRGAEVISGTAVQVDPSEVNSGIDGLSRIGFDPHGFRGEFQTQVRD